MEDEICWEYLQIAEFYKNLTKRRTMTLQDEELLEAFGNFISNNYIVHAGDYYEINSQDDERYDAFEIKEHFKRHLNGDKIITDR